MKVAQVNAYCGHGSTGKICQAISEEMVSRNIENKIYFSQGYTDYKYAVNYGIGKTYTYTQSFLSKLFGNNGFNNRIETMRLLRKMKEFNPDIIHLHNLHAQNCNLQMLGEYLTGKKVIWTFHDCWMFTGYCMYFNMAACNKWKDGCYDCPQAARMKILLDRSGEIWRKKKNIIEKLDMTIITPSNWLKNKVEKSFFKGKDVRVIYNGIDLKIFKPTKLHYSIRKDKYIVLGIADCWDERKGLDVFLKLAEILDDKYQIILIGRSSVKCNFNPRITFISHTENQKELAGLYSMADVFVNPTRDEVLGMVNIEALACGTPVVSFDSGGSPECITTNCGIIVKKDDIKQLNRAIEFICEYHPFDREDCIKRAKLFDQKKVFRKYTDLYIDIYNR